MCDAQGERQQQGKRTIPVREAIGTVLAHDITEIRQGEFKGPAFRKGHLVREEDICHLQRLGKEHLFVLDLGEDELHEDDAARALARALMGDGAAAKGAPKEGKVTIIAERTGLLKVNKAALLAFNMLGDVMCATLHNNTMVSRGQTIAGTRAIPLVVKKAVVDEAAAICEKARSSPPFPSSCAGGVIEVRELRKPRTGVVITGNEVYSGKIKDAFAPVITEKIKNHGGEIVGIYYAPDDEAFIEARLRELLAAGADLLITTGGMSVDPDDVTRFAIRRLGATDITYGSAVLPGAMVLVAHLGPVPVLGIPACGMYAKTTVFDLILPRLLDGERIGRDELAELGHGGLCMKCDTCRYPACSFGKV